MASPVDTAELAVNSTPAAAAGVANGTLVETVNGTAAALEAGVSNRTVLEALYANRDIFIIQGSLIALTLAIIYVGAHGALQRPISAAPREDEDEEDAKKDGKEDDAKRRRRRRRNHTSSVEGLQMSDAIMLPVIASVVLVGLYYLIQYLQDPNLLSKIVRTYSSVIAIASLGKLLGDALHVVTSFVFPNVWVGKVDGVRTLFRVDPFERRQFQRSEAGAAAETGINANSTVWTVDMTRTSPFPDLLAWLAPSPAAIDRAWTVRRMFKEEWSARVFLAGVGSAKGGGLMLNSVLGAVLSLGVTGAYYFFDSSSPMLNNLLGLGFCYGGLLLMSCTSFLIGSLVLAGLFIYDIVMVFYTPFMVTVATNLDAPIKLVARSGGRASLLGLGDIVVPGIYICLCLRYDLYRYYQRQIKQEPTELTTTETTEDGSTTTTSTETKMRDVKATYIDPQGRWGDRFWAGAAQPATPGLLAARFPKPFFIVSMVSYIVGILVAMAVMLITAHGQPALLYLVPSLVIATWGFGLCRGELKEMWAYTEDSEQDVKDVVVEVGPDGKPVEKKKEDGEKEGEKESVKQKGEEDDVLLLAVRAPADCDCEEVDV